MSDERARSFSASTASAADDGARGTGTTIRFWPDPDIFESVDFNYDTISRRLQEMAFLNKGLTITLTDQRASDEELELEAIAEEGDTAALIDGDSFDDSVETVDAVDVDQDGDGNPAEAGDEVAPNVKKKREKKVTFYYPDGLIDYVQHLNSAKKVDFVHEDVIAFEAEDAEAASMALELELEDDLLLRQSQLAQELEDVDPSEWDTGTI